MTTDLAEGIILIVWGRSVVDKVNHVMFWEGGLVKIHERQPILMKIRTHENFKTLLNVMAKSKLEENFTQMFLWFRMFGLCLSLCTFFLIIFSQNPI